MRFPWSGNGKDGFRKVLFGVKDQKAGCFPFEVMSGVTRDVAERAFGDAVNNPETPFFHHPEDYSLWQLGEFDPASGIIYPCEHGPQFWVEAVSLVSYKARKFHDSPALEVSREGN